MEAYETIETLVFFAVQWIKLGVEIIGALVIAWGILIALWTYLPHLMRAGAYDFNPLRLMLARYLALALEFQLGADILGTAIAPTWDQIGQLAAIAVIRTVLNYFLSKEMEREREIIEQNTALRAAADRVDND